MSPREWSGRILTRALGAAAALLATIAAFAGDPGPRRARARIDVAALAQVIEREEDHVTAIELAEWIRDRRPGLRVADVRSRAEFDAYHIPSAELLPLSAIAALAPDADETWVLYSEGGAHAAQAWTLMRATGHERVYFLRGGILDWLEEVMNPVLASATSDSARAAHARVAELSRYFGGSPDFGPATSVRLPLAGDTPPTVERTRRRGC